MSRKKLVLIGAGQIGATAALLAGEKQLGDVVMFDVVEGMPAGKALDLCHLSPIEGFDCKVEGTNSFDAIKDADAIIITAGIPRKPGMSRDDLLAKNTSIIRGVALAIKERVGTKLPFVICVTNPLDAMVQLVKDVTGLPANMVCGMGGVLDAGRFRYFLAEKIGVSVEDTQALVLGGHGDSMVPLIRHTSVSGISLKEMIGIGMISQADVDALVKRTRYAGAELVELLKNGSAFYAPAASALLMAESYLKDKKRLLCCSVFLNGEYGITGQYIGAPCIIGKQGIEKVVEVQLTDEEKAELDKSAEAVRSLCASIPSE